MSDNFYPHWTGYLRRLLDTLEGKSVAVIGHARPDGDCIGSQVALARWLRQRGVEAICANVHPVPRRLSFLLGDTPWVCPDPHGSFVWPEKAILVDCAALDRIGKDLQSRYPWPLAVIDHHVSNPGFGEWPLVDFDSSATAEILAGLFLDAGEDLDPVSAEALYVGIATDTGQFRFPATSQRVFHLCAQLVRCGAQPARTANELYEQESMAKLGLLQRFLSSLQLYQGGKICVGILREADFRLTGATMEDTEGLVDFARGIDGVEVGVLIEERETGIKASLRSKDPVWRLDQVARSFSGGGHACAAGLNVALGLDAFQAQLMKLLGQKAAEFNQSSPHA